MSMQWLSYLAGGLPGLILSAGTGVVFVYGGLRVVHGSITVGTFIAFMAYQMRVMPPLQALMGMYANLATVRVSLRRVLGDPRRAGRSRRTRRCGRAAGACAATSSSTT